MPKLNGLYCVYATISVCYIIFTLTNCVNCFNEILIRWTTCILRSNWNRYHETKPVPKPSTSHCSFFICWRRIINFIYICICMYYAIVCYEFQWAILNEQFIWLNSDSVLIISLIADGFRSQLQNGRHN